MLRTFVDLDWLKNPIFSWKIFVKIIVNVTKLEKSNKTLTLSHVEQYFQLNNFYKLSTKKNIFFSRSMGGYGDMGGGYGMMGGGGGYGMMGGGGGGYGMMGGMGGGYGGGMGGGFGE